MKRKDKERVKDRYLDGPSFEDFKFRVELAVQSLVDELLEKPVPAGSRSLQFAVEAGLEKHELYSVADTALYLGVPRDTLDDEHKAGRLKYVMPKCHTRGAYISVDEVDRWIEANAL